MKEITVGTKSRDIECKITSKEEINTQSEFAVKGLAGIQLLCIQQDTRKDPKFGQLLSILTNCVREIEELYFGKDNEPNPFEEYED